MREIFGLAWKRFSAISMTVGDIQGRGIATLFYFTILVPFGIISRLFTNPLQRQKQGSAPGWLEREPVPTTLEDAKRQG